MNTLNTTILTSRLVRSSAVIFGSLVLAAAPAFADDTAKFQTADSDTSGSLTFDEFKTLMPVSSRLEQVQKKFGRADADDDNLVTLEEWLAYRAEIEEEIADREKCTAFFNESDIDADGFLSYEEFIPTSRGKKPLIVVRKKFLRADTDGDFLLSLEEFLAMKSEKMLDPVKRLKFDLADVDGDEALTLEEFKAVFPKKTPAKTVSKKFNREDSNDDSLLTRDEWNPGGKDESH